ncbi:maleylpyruvate isomerase family mycothiol-dependent enzyme [Streptomyces sp. NPDC047000]|uniref:maleylpyruvate isomerase family mycothiol-dependent enzyme n=1 Tax=Streptomyces sp. NPDC047000 TaxID=3155474 RepID=UPI003406D8E0
METAEFVEILDREGRSLAAAAEEAGMDAGVPPCPGWRIRDLIEHIGPIHRWAAGFVAEQFTSPRPAGPPPPGLDDAALLSWYREGHRQLVDTLSSAAPDVACWHFMPAPTPLAFWARRQAHETAVHRVDAEAARGGGPGVVPAGFALDGIDEILCGFHARAKSRVRSDEPRVLRVRATGTGDDAADGVVWTVRLSQEPPVAERGATAEPDAEISGPAAELYLALWNRLPLPRGSGDAATLRLWRENSAV